MPRRSKMPAADPEFGLVVLQPGRDQQTIGRFLMLILNYRYGLDLITAPTPMEGFAALKEHGDSVRCVAVIQDKEIDTRSSISSLSRNDEIPLFIVVPERLVDAHRQLSGRMKNVVCCAWETALIRTEGSLQAKIAHSLERHGVGELFIEGEEVDFEVMQQRAARRLRNLKALPTLPEIALRIMQLVEDPDSTIEGLEEILTSDPAIVHRVLHLVNAPALAGRGHQGGWTLQDAIVRLGLRKVGAVAQQINMMNRLVKPEESLFDMRRFWEHSVGCALIADRLYKENMVPLREKLEFSDYWIAALLHDCGKLVLGFFFWEHFEDVLSEMALSKTTFNDAERALCDSVGHEFLGQLLLLKSGVGEQLVSAVGHHHATGSDPDDLVCLIHIANNLCKDIGKGYLPGEPVVYSAQVLRHLGLDRSHVHTLQDRIGATMAEEIESIVDRCTQPSA